MIDLLAFLDQGAGSAAVGEEEIVAAGAGDVVLAAEVLAVQALEDALEACECRYGAVETALLKKPSVSGCGLCGGRRRRRRGMFGEG